MLLLYINVIVWLLVYI